MVVYYGMSDKLPNLCYYDSSGQDYGFSKPYSDERARIIDEEVSRIIAEQYERAKSILLEHAQGHSDLADTLIAREVIFTEDVERIFGKRPWTSRTDEIFASREKEEADSPVEDVEVEETKTEDKKSEDNDEKSGEAVPPPYPGEH